MGMVSRQDLMTLSAAAALGGGLIAIAFSAGAHWNQLQSLRPVAVVSEIAGGEEEAAARRKKFALQKWFRSMFNLPPPRLVQTTATVIDQNASFLKVSGGQQCEIEEPEMSLGVEEELSYQNGNGAACLSKVSSTHKPDPFNPSKREGYLSWDDYFMSIAFLSAKRSKDPNRQVGACIVSQDRVILGIGYNGFPRGCSDDELPWAKVSVRGDPLETKYPYVCHAEVNAILNKNHASAAGQRLYVTLFPCNECAKVIIQAGIAEVVYFADKGVHTDNKTGGNEAAYVASRKLLAMAGVKVWQHQPVAKMLVLEFK